MSAALARQLTPASVTQGIPDDAADWLRAHFDWTRGAVWVACERWRVDAATVVAWAEKVRAGGARAGLSTKERTWMVAQLNDPEQRPTAVERAMARTRFRGLEATPPLTIRSIHDAIALLEARLADDARTGDNDHRSDPFRTLLLDDLRALRDGQPDDVRDEQPREQKVSEHDMATHATVYSTREAVCPQCGKTFLARKYSAGWTTYCSRSCGVKGQRASKEASGQATGAFPGVGLGSIASAAQTDTTVVVSVISEPAVTTAPQTEPAAVSDDAPEPERVRVPLVFVQAPASVADALPTTATATNVTSAPRPAAEPTAEPAWPLLSALLERLPASGAWSAQQRERWLRAFTATLDLDVRVDVRVEEGA